MPESSKKARKREKPSCREERILRKMAEMLVQEKLLTPDEHGELMRRICQGRTP